MHVILSPAMNMVRVPAPAQGMTAPRFSGDAAVLAARLGEYDPWQLESLLGVNPERALLAWEEYNQFRGPDPKPTPAMLSFRGLAYTNLAPQEWKDGDLAFAQKRLRILSALYGLLLPLDGILPYRLDFACPYGRRKKLYRYWGSRVAEALFREADTVVNLCSGEYEALVLPFVPPGKRLVSCRFLTPRKGGLRCLATASKMARGKMARFAVENRLSRPGQMKGFDWDGYRYEPALSRENGLVFVQD